MTRHYVAHRPEGDWWEGVLHFVQYDDRLVVERADRRIAMTRTLWMHLDSVSYHPDKQVLGGPSRGGLLLSLGVADDGMGRVTYRYAGTDGDYVLLEMVFA